MIEQLLNHIQRHNLCKTTDKILLAVSGGLDSMVMLHLFRQAGFQIGVAHCNFQLRGEDSDKDEQLVTLICGSETALHIKKFSTKDYAEERGLSTQMAARDLRYKFFYELCENFGYQYVATAHHLNDAIETVLLNLTKGSGIEGVTGIPAKNDQIIRPMLFATRDMMEEYARTNKLAWREDSSNALTDYQRNFIRHQIVPRLKEINPALEETFRNTLERLSGARQFTEIFISRFYTEAVQTENGMIRIDQKKLISVHEPAVLLWELIKPFGFNFVQCKEIVLDHQTGKYFLSPTHQLTIDRAHYNIQPKDQPPFIPVSVDKNNVTVKSNLGSLYIREVSKEEFQLERDAAIAQLDLSTIEYPLLWRNWKPGDFFIPLGMENHKKISDFLIDLRVSLSEKQNVTVLESGGTIVWVVGLRIHEHCKVTDQTQKVLTIKFQAE